MLVEVPQNWGTNGGLDLGFREQGTGNREQGTGNREQGTGNREQGTGNREERKNPVYLIKIETTIL
ncbi:hypothetical protein [Moorena sp. SIO2C4]|uniref:hypothetical protein n=1 Tax=Moorena sp. SIO2C4 TaxID=2607824 RepID=UPI00257F689C|nr:hypothetical protein [Moorena sp. SIO2C4]